MSLPLLTFTQLTQQQKAAIIAASSQFMDFQPGSILLSLIESNSANSIWIQALISALLAVTRLQTSSGNDVDTFIQQFGFSRPQAAAATGVVTFSRTVTTSASYIPAASTIVQTSSGTPVQFTTVVDTTNPAYDATTNSYKMDIGTSSILNIPVQCIQTGIVGNVGAGSINIIYSSLINVTGVTNPSEFTNGSNIATDTQTKADFVLYLQGLSRATYLAIAFAVVNTPHYGTQITRYQIIENKNTDGDTLYGFFFVVVDNGSGSPPTDLINAVKSNIELYRGLSIMYDVIAPDIVPIVISVSIKLANDTSENRTAATNAIKSALLNYINLLPIGGTKIVSFPVETDGFLYYSAIYDIIYNSSTNIINATSLLVNVGTSNIALNFKEIALIASDDITINYI